MATIDLKLISLEQRLPGSPFPLYSGYSISRFPGENCGIRSSTRLGFPRGRACISTPNPTSADRKEIKRLLGQAPAIRNACDLDLLLFLHRHPRTLLTSEQVAAFVGYDIQGIAKSLETFIEADLLERTQNPMHAARMYEFVLDGPQNGGIRELLQLASTRNGRHSILQALDTGGSQPETEAPQRKPKLLKIA